MKNLKYVLLFAAIALLGVVFTASAVPTPDAYEGIDYGTDPLLAQAFPPHNGGIGWAGPWVARLGDSQAISEGSLSYGTTTTKLTPVGGKVDSTHSVTSSSMWRSLATTWDFNETGNTVYYSFLIQQYSSTAGGSSIGAGLTFNTDIYYWGRVYCGIDGDKKAFLGYNINSQGIKTAANFIVLGRTYLFVVKAVSGADVNDDWVGLKVYDTTTDTVGTEPGPGEWTLERNIDLTGNLNDWLKDTKYGVVNAQFDEIRIGDSWEDVTGGPMPTCFDPVGQYILDDFNYYCIIDLMDVSILTEDWLAWEEPPVYKHGDLNEDNTVNLPDFVRERSVNWMKSAKFLSVVSNLSAEYRNGQVFLIWDEAASNENNIKVYMSDKEITPATLGDATLLTDMVEAHSGNDWFDDANECPWTVDPAHGWIIEPNRTPLDRTGGLFVHTVVGSDPNTAYFAVLGPQEDANYLKAGENSLSSSVELEVNSIEAVWQLSGSQPTGSGKPLVLNLHAHTGHPKNFLTHVAFGDANMGWREGLPIKFKVSVLSNAVVVEPYDRVWINRKLGASETYESYNRLCKNIESWHYGTNDKIYDPTLRLTGTPTNYTERIMLWMLDWVQTTYQTDPNRVYGSGKSMGTGIQRLAMENPERFASVDLLVPVLDWGNEDIARRWISCCGDVNLVCSDGMPLRDRLDLVDFMEEETGDLPHVTIRVGRQDTSVYWKRKPPYMYAMQQNRHGLLVGWDDGTHLTAMLYPIEAFPDFLDYDWYIERFASNKSYPVFTGFSLDDNPGNGDKTDGDIVGFMNRGLDWDSIVDTSTRYEVQVFSTHPDTSFPETVNITPRRRQLFIPNPGSTVNASNLDCNDTTVDTKTLTVDANGLITYEGFEITSSAGNTMVLELP